MKVIRKYSVEITTERTDDKECTVVIRVKATGYSNGDLVVKRAFDADYTGISDNTLITMTMRDLLYYNNLSDKALSHANARETWHVANNYDTSTIIK